MQVLAEVDADGINTAELARRIQRSGLRDLRSSKTPEASLAGALARDVIFCRVAPSTFCAAGCRQLREVRSSRLPLTPSSHCIMPSGFGQPPTGGAPVCYHVPWTRQTRHPLPNSASSACS